MPVFLVCPKARTALRAALTLPMLTAVLDARAATLAARGHNP